MILYLLIPALAYSQVDDYKVVDIVLNGNVKTKDYIIYREIEFSIGDTLSSELLNEKIANSRLNLLRTQLFNFVDVEVVENEKNLDIVFNFQERWYYWVYPILEHSERNLSTFLYYKDFNRVNYGLAFDWYNFRGKDEVLRFKTRFGFKEHYAISYHKPGFGKRRVDGIWIFADLFRQKKAIYGVDNNLPVYVESSNKYLNNAYDLGVEYTFRPEILYFFEFGLKYQGYYFRSDTLSQNIEMPIQSFAPKASFKYDKRNSLVYPTKGFYAHFRISGIVPLNKDYADALSLTAIVQTNTKFGTSAFGLRNELFLGRMLMEKDKNLLFDEMFKFFGSYVIRGYEYYYFPSNSLVGLKNTLNWKICDFRLNVLPKILPDEFSKFFSIVYLEAFSDFAYTQSFDYQYIENDNFTDALVYSLGAGISIETYYDRLLQFHVAYNSCFDKFGIFAEFRTPIYKKY